MNQKFLKTFVLLTLFIFMTACAGSGGNNDDKKVVNSNSQNTVKNDIDKPGSNDDISEESLKKSPKDSIAYQFELLKKGDTDNLKECFTERQKDKITEEAVNEGKAEASKYTFDDLVDSIEDGEFEGKKTAKIKIKNGRTLTTLVQTDGKWLADTVWFK